MGPSVPGAKPRAYSRAPTTIERPQVGSQSIVSEMVDIQSSGASSSSDDDLDDFVVQDNDADYKFKSTWNVINIEAKEPKKEKIETVQGKLQAI